MHTCAKFTYDSQLAGNTFNTILAPEIDDNGEVFGILAITRDITKRAKLEHEIQEREANLRALIENTPDFIWSIDTNYRLLTLNSKFANIFETAFGHKLEPGVRIIDLIPEDVLPFWKACYVRALNGEQFQTEYIYLFQDQQLTFDLWFSPILLDDGTIGGTTCFSRDITAQKKAEEKLRDSEQKYRLIAENSTDIITATNKDSRLQYISPSITPVLGYTVKERLFSKVWDIVHPDDVDRLLKSRENYLKSGSGIFEYRIRHKNGHYMWAETSVRLINEADITDSEISIIGETLVISL